MAKSRATRCVQLSKLVEQEPEHSARQLAKRLGVSKRSIFRYRRVLKEAANGMQTWTDAPAPRKGGRRDCRPVFTEQEAMALVLAIQASPVATMEEHRIAVQCGLAKLLNTVSAKTRKRVARLSNECLRTGTARSTGREL
jgi:predicted DNA-binding transcriptional regulator YafY